MTTQLSHSFYLGDMRFWRSSEDCYIALYDSAGNPESGVSLSTTNGAQVVIVAPDGTERTYDGSQAETVWTEVETGVYKLTLWGSGAAVAADQLPLEQVGRYAVHVTKVGVTQFEEFLGWYEVKANFDAVVALTDVPATSTTRSAKAMVAIYSGWDHQLLDLSNAAVLAELTAITLEVFDRSGAKFLSLDKADSSQAADALWFSKSGNGLTGGDVLFIDLKFTYKGVTHHQGFPIVSRYGA